MHRLFTRKQGERTDIMFPGRRFVAVTQADADVCRDGAHDVCERVRRRRKGGDPLRGPMGTSEPHEIHADVEFIAADSAEARRPPRRREGAGGAVPPPARVGVRRVPNHGFAKADEAGRSHRHFNRLRFL